MKRRDFITYSTSLIGMTALPLTLAAHRRTMPHPKNTRTVIVLIGEAKHSEFGQYIAAFVQGFRATAGEHANGVMQYRIGNKQELQFDLDSRPISAPGQRHIAVVAGFTETCNLLRPLLQHWKASAVDARAVISTPFGFEGDKYLGRFDRAMGALTPHLSARHIIVSDANTFVLDGDSVARACKTRALLAAAQAATLVS